MLLNDERNYYFSEEGIVEDIPQDLTVNKDAMVIETEEDSKMSIGDNSQG